MSDLPKVEIIHGRDPDSECGIDVYVDGVRVTQFYLEDIDPGRGHTRQSWDENTEALRENTTLSPAFREAAIAAREEFGDSKYIEDERPPGWMPGYPYPK